MESSDAKIVKVELYDADAMVVLANHDGIDVDVKRALKSYRRLRENGNQVQVVYEHGKELKKLRRGRIYPRNARGLQSLPSDIRAALAAKYYWDIDIANAQPVLLTAWSKKNGWACPRLEEYTLNRSEKLGEVMDALACDRDAAKEFCLAILFGLIAKYRKVPDYFSALMDEIDVISKNCAAANPELFEICKKADKKNPYASCLAHYIQTKESEVLLFIDSWLKGKGRGLDVLIHDGGLVRRLPEETQFPSELLRDVETAIEAEFGFRVRMEQKPLINTYGVIASEVMRGMVRESEYQARKMKFEETNFWCMDTHSIVEELGEVLRHTTTGAQSQYVSWNFEKTVDGEIKTQSFIMNWLDDSKRRTIQGLVFKPEGCADDEYNLYKGMAGSKPTDVREDIVGRFKLLLVHNAGKDDVMTDYITKWLALLVQKPWIIPGVAIILVNEKQGSGKDTFVDFIGKRVVGEELYSLITDAKKDVFGPHSQTQEKCLLMKFEEANGYDNRTLSDVLKALITQKTALINPKGLKAYTVDTYTHLMMTTNNPVPVKVEADDRRFCIVKTSDEFVGNRDFWKETYRLLEAPEAAHSIWKYLMGIDISGFDVRAFPKNDYHQSLAHTEVSSTTAFVNSLEELEECSGTQLHQKYLTFCRDNGHEAKNCVHFCRLLSSIAKLKRRTVSGKSLYSMG